MNNNIQPLKGFRDFLPEEAAARQEVFRKIRVVFETYGFLPLETPALEYREILAGKYGEESEKLIYSFQDRGGRDVALRYDFTVPLARVLAQYQNDLSIPFKRYQIGLVWRAENPQKGRFREFTQCDIDIAGTSSIFADAEVIACLNAALRSFGVNDTVIRINNRKVLEGLVRAAGIGNEKFVPVVRLLDKLEKAGEEAIRGELALLGIQTAEADKLFSFLNQGLEDGKEILSRLDGVDGAGELAELVEILLDQNIKNYEVDLTLARGLDYYTGTIFEIRLPDAAEFGSIAGGGRYDKLVGIFSGKDIPAVGGSIGIDRLLAALEELELLQFDLVSDVLVCNLDEDLTEKYLQIVQELRRAGVKTDFYFEPAKLTKQLKYADKKNINFVVIIGPDEEKKGEATVKNLATGKQERIRHSKLVQLLKAK